MNENWSKLIKQFENDGLSPSEVQGMVTFYDKVMYEDKWLKKVFADLQEEEDERDNQN